MTLQNYFNNIEKTRKKINVLHFFGMVFDTKEFLLMPKGIIIILTNLKQHIIFVTDERNSRLGETLIHFYYFFS